MTSRIDALTDEQRARFAEWREKWVSIGLRTGPTDWAAFEAAVRACYRASGLPEPAVVIKAASPMACVQADSALARIFRAQVRDQVHDQVGAQVHDQVGAQVRDQVHDQVGAQVRDQVHDQVHDQVSDQVDDQVRAQVGDQVSDQVRAQVRDQVHAQVGDQVSDQVRAQVSDQVDPVRAGGYFGGQFWVGGYWWGAPSFVSFFTDVAGLELPAGIVEKAAAYRSACEAGSWWMPSRGFCVITARPTFIKRDAAGRLHAEDGNAIEWPDGWGVACWHGTRVPVAWLRDRSSLTATVALTHPNIEQRRAACEILGWAAILGALNARVLDEDEDPEVGTLLEVDLPDSPRERFLRVRCGTGREFVLPVDPKCRTAASANAWTYGIDAKTIRAIEHRT